MPYRILGGFPGGSAGKASACNVEDLDSIPGLGRSPGEGSGTPALWPGEFYGLFPWSRKESDTTERLFTPSLTHYGNKSLFSPSPTECY